MANVEHSVLTGSDLHEPKGVAAAAANRVYVSNGAASGTWSQVPAAAIAAAGVLVFQGQFWHSSDQRSSGTNGDLLTSGTWNTRTINTEHWDDLGITASGNQFALTAGTWHIEVTAVTNFQGTAAHGSTQAITSKLRLRNITDSTTLNTGVGNRFQMNDDGGGNDQPVNMSLVTLLSERFILAGTKTLEIQNWVANGLSSPTTRGGIAISSGDNECYLDIRLWKCA
jgi:hypothetical protein